MISANVSLIKGFSFQHKHIISYLQITEANIYELFIKQGCYLGLGVWVGYGGVKTLENRSRKFNLLIFSRLPRYVYMDDILGRFKRKERGSSSSDSETSPQGKRVCSQEPNETDEILFALDMSKDIGVKLQEVLDKLGKMDKKN